MNRHKFTLQNRYTHAPLLSPNLLIGSMQLLSWLFFHPTAWRNHIAHIEPTLPANFCLAQLSRSQWKNPKVYKLLVSGFVIPTMLFTAVALFVHLLADGREAIWFGIATGLFLGLMFSITISLASGLTVGTMTSLVCGSIYAQANLLAIDLMAGLSFGIIFGVMGGVVGFIADNMTKHTFTQTLSRQIGAVIIGVLASAIIITVIIGVVLMIGLWTNSYRE